MDAEWGIGPGSRGFSRAGGDRENASPQMLKSEPPDLKIAPRGAPFVRVGFILEQLGPIWNPFWQPEPRRGTVSMLD